MSKIKPASRALPQSPSLEKLKKQARALLKAARAGAPEAVARVRTAHPRAPIVAALERFSLSDAQLCVAREHGFDSWPKLKAHVAAQRPSSESLSAALALLPASDIRALVERLHARLMLVARRIEWVSRVQLEAWAEASDLAALIRAAVAHCEPSMKQAALASRDPRALVDALCAALEPVLGQHGLLPLGAAAGDPDERVEAAACLVVLHAARHPHLLGRRFPLVDEITRIGRQTSNQILLHSDSVSREHARIERRDGTFVLTDQNSTNGCFVNEAPESVPERVLEDGDRVAIGDALLVFLAGPELEQKYRAAIEYISEHDALTQVLNQASWVAETDRQILYSRGSDRALSALLVGVDQLSELSLRIGQLGGNALLLGVAQVLRQELGEGALVGRYAGGQFAITLPGADCTSATALAERLRQAVSARSLSLFGESVSVTVSVGVATLYRTTGTGELVQDALGALARAQGAGRNRVRGPQEAAA